MATLSTTLTIADKIIRFEKSDIYKKSYKSPIIRALMFTLCSINWEGNTSTLNDLFEDSEDDQNTYIRALEKLSYSCDVNHFYSGYDLETIQIDLPCLLKTENNTVLLLNIKHGLAQCYDYKNDIEIKIDLKDIEFTLIQVSKFSRTFRDAAGIGNAKQQWTKSIISPYRTRVKKIFFLSFIINMLSSLNPFFIMSVYNFALTSSSISTLYWIIIGGIIVVGLEVFFKQERNSIFQEAGEEIASTISRTVVSKLVWMPYAKASGANEASQIARLKDIDMLRKTFTAESTQNYFDMPFFIIFLIALVILAGSTAGIIISGLILYILYGVISKVNYNLAATQSSAAGAKVQSQWHDTLSNLQSIQGLPLQKISTMRFTSAYKKSNADGTLMSTLNQKTMRDGQSISQVIGCTCIVYASYMVMEGDLDFGAMLAIIMLIWKCLSPFMGIYNSINKLSQVKKASQQVDALMMIDDDRKGISDSTPIIDINGLIEFKDVGLRHPVSGFSLKQLAFKVNAGEIFTITGVSGSGKTTILDIIAKLLENYQGNVLIDDMNIKQFNGYIYRGVLRYKSNSLEYFNDSFSENFYLYNGYHNDNFIRIFIKHFKLSAYFPEQEKTMMNHELSSKLPSYVKEITDIILCLGSKDSGLLLIDNALSGKDSNVIKSFIRFIEDHYSNATMILVSNDPYIIANSSNVLLMEKDGSQKFCGSPEKILDQYDSLLNTEL